MIRFLLPFLFIMSVANNSFAACPQSSAVIGAKYKITLNKPNEKTSSSRYFVLLRNNNQVAHQYSGSAITEVWQQTNNASLRLVRYFDKYKRGIEYQPNEINNGKGERNWDVKNQLITDKLIKSMQQKSVNGKGCDKVKRYTLKTNNKLINLEWLSQRRLLKTYSETTTSGKLKWKLVNIITNKNQINNVFSSREDYQTTDYTDIGDNESDPFLIKMINLGFVEHAASGFYDANGNLLKSNTSGRHHQH